MAENASWRGESGGEGPSAESTIVVRLEDLSQLISAKRRRERLTLEEAAKQTGVSPATLSRWERRGRANADVDNPDAWKGPREPDTRTLAALAGWLGVSIDRVVDSQAASLNIPEESGSTPDIVEAHLRADRNLDPATAEALALVFRAAYEQFSGLVSNSSASPLREESAPPESDTKGANT